MDTIESARQRKKEFLLKNKRYKQNEQLFHRRTTGKYVGDLVYGANDGIITTFAVVAGVSGASLEPVIILILGFANLLADGVSMGASNFLGEQSEKSFAKAQREKEEWEIDNLKELEVEEIREIYEKKGFMGKDLEAAVGIITSNRKVWVDTMMREELGIIEDSSDDPRKHALATFTAFVVAGFVPLVPFLIPGLPYAFIISAFVAALTLFTVGALRTLVTAVSWLRGGLEMLVVGSITGILAYSIGAFIEQIVR